METKNLVAECEREFDNCNYTAVSYIIWLRDKRRIRFLFITLPLVLSSFATWELIARSDHIWVRTIASFCSLLAGLIPSLYTALKYDEDLERLKHGASEYFNLRDRFRQCAILGASKPAVEFESDFNRLMDRMEKARRDSLTAPERYFSRAQKKIESGDYSYAVDEKVNPWDVPAKT
jgi:hypothetical protein